MLRRINALSDHGRQHQTTKVTFSAMSNTKTPSLHNFHCTIMSNTITIEEQNKIEPQSEQLKRNTSADRERGKRCTTFTMKITVLTAERSGATAVKHTFWHHNRCCQHQAIPTQSPRTLGTLMATVSTTSAHHASTHEACTSVQRTDQEHSLVFREHQLCTCRTLRSGFSTVRQSGCATSDALFHAAHTMNMAASSPYFSDGFVFECLDTIQQPLSHTQREQRKKTQ